MDLWVLNAQHWMNSNYGSVPGYQAIAEDGIAGWGTMYGLTRALQHELGITSLSNTFGDGTAAAFASKIGQISSKTSNGRVVGILQCAMWCKGYSGGTEFGTWEPVLDGSISTVRAQLGLTAGSTVDVKLMRSLLTLDAYVRLGAGRDAVRDAQQWLNGRYASHSSYRLVPCDGVYSRDVQFGFMLGLQFEMDMADGVANGNFGPGTQSGLKSKADVGSGSVDGTKRWVSLFQIALVFNGYDVPRSGTFDATTVSTTRAFQSFLLIAVTGRGDFDTWAALLVSTGNPDRAVVGVDTSTPVSAEYAVELRASGYTVIGRYLTVASKAIARGELDRLFDAGFSVFPIMQNYNNAAEYFSYDIGYDQGYQAALRARQIGFSAGTVIFFSVDYDAFATEVGGILKSYFSGVAAGMKNSVKIPYKIGVYATRYIADQVHRNGWADAIWVSGMSTGYSGNLGYPMPTGWWYNQIQEISSKNIDRNAVSPSARPATHADVSTAPAHSKELWEAQFQLSKLQFVAESTAARYNLIPPSGPSLHVLSFLMQKYYNPRLVDPQFAAGFALYLPLPEHSGGDVGLHNIAVRASIDAAGQDVTDVLANLPGDSAHAAATAQGVFQQGDHAGSSTVGTGDLGGWALDLATFWKYYVTMGDQRPSVESFTDSHLAVADDPYSFSEADFFADADGWLIGRLVRQGVSADEAYRRVYRDLPEPKERVKRFLSLRFGSETALQTTIINTFRTDSFINWAAILAFLNFNNFPDEGQLNALARRAARRFYEKAAT